MRGAGLLLFAGRAARRWWRWSSYHADDASLNNANGRAGLQSAGAAGRHRRRSAAADLRLRRAGVPGAAVVLGHARASGKTLRYAMWRLLAWPLGTLTVAAGLGIFPAPASLPAGAGGMIGIAAAGLSAHAGAGLWPSLDLAWRLPLFLLAGGSATGLPGHGPALHAAWRARCANLPAGVVWLAGLIKMSKFRKP